MTTPASAPTRSLAHFITHHLMLIPDTRPHLRDKPCVICFQATNIRVDLPYCRHRICMACISACPPGRIECPNCQSYWCNKESSTNTIMYHPPEERFLEWQKRREEEREYGRPCSCERTAEGTEPAATGLDRLLADWAAQIEKSDRTQRGNQDVNAHETPKTGRSPGVSTLDASEGHVQGKYITPGQPTTKFKARTNSNSIHRRQGAMQNRRNQGNESNEDVVATSTMKLPKKSKKGLQAGNENLQVMEPDISLAVEGPGDIPLGLFSILLAIAVIAVLVIRIVDLISGIGE